MNSLSWLLYLAGVSENFGWLLFWLGFLVIIGGVVLYCFSFSLKEAGRRELNDYYYRDETSDKYKQAVADKASAAKQGASVSVWGRTLMGCGLAAWFLAAAAPSKETVYAIAASEMGEELLKTPTATKAVKALDAWLDKQLAVEVPKAP